MLAVLAPLALMYGLEWDDNYIAHARALLTRVAMRAEQCLQRELATMAFFMADLTDPDVDVRLGNGKQPCQCHVNGCSTLMRKCAACCACSCPSSRISFTQLTSSRSTSACQTTRSVASRPSLTTATPSR